MPISKIKTSSILADAASTNLNIDAGTLFLDTTNNFVGIGTTSPANRLTVLAPVNTNSYAQITTSGTGNSYLGLTALGSTTNELSTNNSGDFVITSAGIASDVFKMVHTGAVTSTLVLKTGNVGIGTLTPLVKLHVTTAGVAAVPATSGTTLSTGTLIRLGTSSDSAGGIGTIGLSTNQMWIQATDSTNLATTYPLLLNPNGGNVGIGTTSPSAKFVVSNSGANGIEFNPTGASIVAYNRTTQVYTDMNTSSLSMAFNTGDSPSARVYIDSSGNVMIGNGTTASTSRLSISGGSNASQIRWEVASAAFTQEISTNAAQSAYAGKQYDASYHMWRLSSTETMTLDAAANLCIGSTGANNVYDQVAGARPLVIQKSSTSTTLNASTAAITIVNGATTTSNSAQLNFAAITGASTNQYSSAIISTIFGARTNGQYPTGQLVFSTSTTLNTAPTEKMRITSAGNLLIGSTTADPTNKIDVLADNSDKRIAIRNQNTTSDVSIEAQANDYWSGTSYTGTAIQQFGSAATGTTQGISNANLGVLRFQNGGSSLIYTNTGNPIIIATGGTERMRFQGDSVTIGYNQTSTTQVIKSFATAHAVGNRGASIRFGMNDGSFAGMIITDQASSNASYNGQDIRFETHQGAVSAGERMRITADGVVELTLGQIKFPATQVASSNVNTLDDYEEGNWTPNINGSATGTFSVKVGTYVKIGKQVTIWFRVDGGTSGTGGATQYLDGLPFNVGTYSDSSMVGSMGTNGPTLRIQSLLTLSANRAVLYIYNGGNQEATPITYASGTATYWVD